MRLSKPFTFFCDYFFKFICLWLWLIGEPHHVLYALIDMLDNEGPDQQVILRSADQCLHFSLSYRWTDLCLACFIWNTKWLLTRDKFFSDKCKIYHAQICTPVMIFLQSNQYIPTLRGRCVKKPSFTTNRTSRFLPQSHLTDHNNTYMYCFKLSDVVFILLIIVKMPTIVGILTCVGIINHT